MHKHLLTGILILLASIGITTAQKVELSPVDAFFKVTETLNKGKDVSAEQWKDFDYSLCYRGHLQNGKTKP